MRYSFPGYYINILSPVPKECDLSEEVIGSGLCSGPRGTGYNDKSAPVWYFGDATLGNCRGQIVVNDRCMRAKRLNCGNDESDHQADPPSPCAREASGRRP